MNMNVSFNEGLLIERRNNFLALYADKKKSPLTDMIVGKFDHYMINDQ